MKRKVLTDDELNALLAVDHGQSGMSELRTEIGIDGVHG